MRQTPPELIQQYKSEAANLRDKRLSEVYHPYNPRKTIE